MEEQTDPVVHGEQETNEEKKSKKAWYSRARFIGAIMFNTAAMMVPATYLTLSKAWVAHINTTDVAITDSYTYLGVIAKVLNEGLPSVGYLIIGDVTISKEKRFNLIHSLVCFQALAGLVMSSIFILAASFLSSILIPGEVSSKSIQYIQISSCSIFFNVVDCTIVLAFRTADRPDIPIIINITKTLVNIILDIVLISKFRIIDVTTVNIQAISRLICSSVLWTLPWTIALSLRESKDEMDWYFFGYVIGGGLITSFVVTVASELLFVVSVVASSQELGSNKKLYSKRGESQFQTGQPILNSHQDAWKRTSALDDGLIFGNNLDTGQSESWTMGRSLFSNINEDVWKYASGLDDGIIPNKNRIVKEIDKPELWAMGRRISNNMYHNGWKHVSGLEDGIIPNKNQNTMLPEHELLPLFLDYDTPVHNEGWKHFMDLEDGLIVDQNGHYTYNELPENYN
ncbi:hypothetical protein QYM36_011243, partial [Artemia franciscana]